MKLVSMRDAIAANVNDGDTVVIDGFTHLICFAAGHEIIRQGRKNLTAVRLTPDLVYDQMIASGCVGKLVFSWAGNPGAGSLHAFRRAIEGKGDEGVVGGKGGARQAMLQLEEYSHFGLLARLMAGSANLPFWPLRNYAGTDLPAVNPSLKSVTCPFTGEVLAAVPALRPDVAIVHCQRADANGNAQVWGLFGSQKESAFAAKRVIVVAEEIVSESVIRSDPNRTLIPEFIVSQVVHEPWGCHPSYVQGFYDRDNEFYQAWDDIGKDPGTYANYLESFVYGCADRPAYLKKLDDGVLQKLRRKLSQPAAEVDYGY